MTLFRPLRALSGGLALAPAAAPVTAAPAPPVKPWVPHAEIPCDWWLSGPNGKEEHASIGQGDEDPVLSVVEPALLPFDSGTRPRMILRANGDPARAVTLEVWPSGDIDSVLSVGRVGSVGMYLTAEARRILGGATRMEIVFEGKILSDIPLAQTPSQAALDACVLPPKTEDSDEE